MVTITHSQVFVSTSADTDSDLGRSTSTTSYRPDVKFSYHVAHMPYESDLLQATDIVHGYASHEAAAQVLAPFPLGAEVQAWVNPEHAEKAFLLTEKSAAPLVFIAIGVLLAPLAWWVGRYV